jgi:hypothetical protein
MAPPPAPDSQLQPANRYGVASLTPAPHREMGRGYARTTHGAPRNGSGVWTAHPRSTVKWVRGYGPPTHDAA